MLDAGMDALGEALATNRRLTVEMGVKQFFGDDSGTLRSLVPAGVEGSSHLTVLHIGRVGSLWEELAQSNGGLSRELFLKELRAYQVAFSARFSTEERVPVIGLETLSHDGKSFQVLTIAPSKRLENIRNWCRVSFLKSLSRLGIVDAETFMATSPAVDQISAHWLPHITIAKQPSGPQRTLIISGVDCLLRPPSYRL